MTCIVGVEHAGGVVIGGDSAGVGGQLVDIRSDAKVFKRGPYLMGFTTSFRMGQLLRYGGKEPPKVDLTQELDLFMATKFIDWVRETEKDGGFLHNDSGRETNGSFLVGVKKTLYLIDSDLQIGRSSNGYLSVGCGEAIALGSLFSTPAKKPRDRVRLALEAATHHSTGVRGPYVIESV
jgi:ATP-dependent protease HslVU (ClpYQ) peptidase subunit